MNLCRTLRWGKSEAWESTGQISELFKEEKGTGFWAVAKPPISLASLGVSKSGDTLLPTCWEWVLRSKREPSALEPQGSRVLWIHC